MKRTQDSEINTKLSSVVFHWTPQCKLTEADLQALVLNLLATMKPAHVLLRVMCLHVDIVSYDDE